MRSWRPIVKGDRVGAGPAGSRRASRIAGILETVVAGKVREIAIAHDVGDSVLYHPAPQLASPQELLGTFVQDGEYSLKSIAAAQIPRVDGLFVREA